MMRWSSEKPRLPRAVVWVVWAVGYAAAVAAFTQLFRIMDVPR